MSNVTTGEQWKLDLLTGQKKPGEAVDVVLDNLTAMTNNDVAQVLLPTAALRASQIERGLKSEDAETREEAERIHKRYTASDQIHPQNDALARDAVAKEGGEHSDLARAIASSWLEKLISNDRVGEMEKELGRTVDTYRTEKQEQRLELRHHTNLKQAIGR